MIQKPTKPIFRNYAVKSDDDPKTNKKPISRSYAVKSDDDPKTNKKPISGSYAVKSDDDPKNQIIYPGNYLIQLFPWGR